MRKPRDFDAELKSLEDKARDLKARKVEQLGELVISTGADALSAEELAGALIVLAETKDAGKREAWAKRGAAFFQGRTRRTAPASGIGQLGEVALLPHDGGQMLGFRYPEKCPIRFAAFEAGKEAPVSVKKVGLVSLFHTLQTERSIIGSMPPGRGATGPVRFH